MAEPEQAIQEAAVAVGRWPVRAVRRPARACPRDKETPWLWGEYAAPILKRGTDPAQPGTQGSGARQLASGGRRGNGCPGQGVQSLPARRGGTHFPGQQLNGQPTSPWPILLLPPPPSSPGLEPSWALGARVTVSGLAGPRPRLCQLAIATATSHYLARPAREGY